MEIKRKFEMSVATNRRYIIRQPAFDGQITCADCGELMLRVEQAAGLLGITQRHIFQIIEAEAANFTETETGAVLICLLSLAAVLEGRERNNQIQLSNTAANSD